MPLNACFLGCIRTGGHFIHELVFFIFLYKAIVSCVIIGDNTGDKDKTKNSAFVNDGTCHNIQKGQGRGNKPMCRN